MRLTTMLCAYFNLLRVTLAMRPYGYPVEIPLSRCIEMATLSRRMVESQGTGSLLLVFALTLNRQVIQNLSGLLPCLRLMQRGQLTQPITITICLTPNIRERLPTSVWLTSMKGPSAEYIKLVSKSSYPLPLRITISGLSEGTLRMCAPLWQRSLLSF